MMIYALITAGLTLWCLSFITAPLFLDEGGLAARGTRYFFSYVCHQNPDRSFQITGKSMTVCARCTGIYFGTLTGVLLFPFLIGKLMDDFPWKKWLILALGVNLLEAILSGLTPLSSLLIRAGAGMILGSWTAFCVLFAIYKTNQTRLNWET